MIENIVKRLLDVQSSCPTDENFLRDVQRVVTACHLPFLRIRMPWTVLRFANVSYTALLQITLARDRQIVDLNRNVLVSPPSLSEASIETSVAGFIRPGKQSQPLYSLQLQQNLEVCPVCTPHGCER